MWVGIVLVGALMLGTEAIPSATRNRLLSLRGPPPSRAITDVDAKPDEFPHQAYIAGADEWVYCGALISRTVILTVAEPIHRYDHWKIYMGLVDRENPGEGVWTTETNWAVKHSKYVFNKNDYNIGIIFLKENAPKTRYIKPVPLPTPEEQYDCFVHSSAMMSGWGKDLVIVSNRLRWIHLDIVESSECMKHFENGSFTGRMLCAAKKNTEMCGADMGAPLVIRSGNNLKLIGVATFHAGKPCKTPGPHIFIRVTSFLGWINSAIANHDNDD